MAHDNPVHLFQKYFQKAKSVERNAEIMTLATVGKDLQPSARLVLFKGVIDDSFSFYSNYQSKKAQQMSENTKVALVFYWNELHLQVRVEGEVSLMNEELSDEYFKTRPRESQLNTWASSQSSTIEARKQLLDSAKEKRLEFMGQDIPRPPHWGGYLVKPSVIEFWEGDEFRLHHRRCFTKGDVDWSETLLSP